MNKINNDFLRLCGYLNANIDPNKFNPFDFKINTENMQMDSIKLYFNEIPSFEEYFSFFNIVKSKLNKSDCLFMEIENLDYSKKYFNKYLKMCFKMCSNGLNQIDKSAIENEFFSLYKINKNGVLSFVSDSKNVIDSIKSIENILKTLLKNHGMGNIIFDISYVDNFDRHQIMENNIKEKLSSAVYIPPVKKVETVTTSFNGKFRGNAGVYVEKTLSQLNDPHNINESSKVIIKGEIFKLEIKTLPTGTKLYSVEITDYKEAFKLVAFAKQEKQIEYFNELKVGRSFSFKGEVKYNKFSNENTLTINTFEEINSTNSVPIDDSKKPRIELNAKTSMSTLDGFRNADEMTSEVLQMGLAGLAILDIDNVQSFPDFFNANTKKKQFKKIYGASFSTISHKNNAIFKFRSNLGVLDDLEYIAFDLETTGLSPILDEIIEFGAVVVKGGKIHEKYQFFLQASEPLSDFTMRLTHITQYDVDNGYTQAEGIKKIFDIIKNKIALAHNASFDMNFLLQKFEEHNLGSSNTVYIDTLAISRMIQPEAKSHTLQNVSGKFGVDYNVTVAHRADYDANVLGQLWIVFIKHLARLGIETTDQLNDYYPEDTIAKARTNEVSVIAQNEKGLKNLYKSITKLLTGLMAKTNSKTPRIYEKDLSNQEGILLGSSTLRGKVFDALFYGSLETLREEIAKYDYIEITPPHNFLHLEDNFSQYNVEKLLKLLVKEAKKQNKLVVAVSDARYVKETDKYVHRVLVHSSGIGNRRHYLYNYSKAKERNLKYPLQYIPTTNQMKLFFNFLNDPDLIDEIVVENTYKIANTIEDLTIIKPELFTPEFDNSDINLEKTVYETARQKYGENLPEVIEKRIKKEITPIIKYGYSVVYWISRRLVMKSIEDGYYVGSRGSVGSSFVATMSGITEVNPLEPHYLCPKCKKLEFVESLEITSGFDLEDKMCEKCNILMDKDGQSIPFETFLGFNADKVPDIDLNFSSLYQSQIHLETRKIFGEAHAFRAGTISTSAFKTSYGYVKKYAEETGQDFSNSFTSYLASQIEGSKRTTSQHPGGIVIVPKKYDIEDFTPVNYPSDDVESTWLTTHFNFKSIHDTLLKLDLLGHEDPTAIRMLERLCNIKVSEIPKMDKKVISIFSSTKELNIVPGMDFNEKTGAIGLPEFGTTFVREMLSDVTVESFADLISISGLSHGTDVWLNNAQTLAKNHGWKLKDLISCRDDIMVYLMKRKIEPLTAFQIMESVRKGKSITNEQEELLKKNNISQDYIESMKKIKYMFPKAHATAYVIMAWRVAWFKVYKPLEHYATFFTVRANEFDIKIMSEGKQAIVDKINLLLESKKNIKWTPKESALFTTLEVANEMVSRGFKFGNLSVRKSHSTEWIINYKTNSIIPPFNAVEGLGDKIAESIIEAREKADFTSIEDFVSRTSINKTQLEKFHNLNAFEGLNKSEQMSLF